MARYSIFVHHISNRARVHCKRHIKHQPMRCLWLQTHMKIQRMKAPSKPSAKRLRTAKYSRHKADNANQKMLILQLLFQFTHYHNRPHVYTTPLLSAQSTRHVLATNSSPDQITTHLHESEPKAPTSPSSITTLTLLSGLRNFSHNHPGGELNKTEGTSSVQVPSLSYSREQNHTGGLKPFSRSDMPLWHCRPKYHLA